MPGRVYLQGAEPDDLVEGPNLFDRNTRHSAVRVVGDEIQIFHTRVGDVPERILLSLVDGSRTWTEWTASEPVDLLRPERVWEGVDLAMAPSQRRVAPGRVNQLRDPAIFEEGDLTDLVYAVAGENGLGIAQLR